MQRFLLIAGCLLLSSAAYAQSFTTADVRFNDIALGDTTALVVWRENVFFGQQDIRFGLADHHGHPLTASGTLASAIESDPHIAWDGTRYLVVWMAIDEMVGALIDESGMVHGPFTITTASAL